MKKRELIYRELLSEAADNKKARFTQLALSKKFAISLSTVSYALEPLKAMGVLALSNRGFRVLDRRKLLLYWASIRNLKKDIIYSTRVNSPVSRLEKSMPPGVLYTAYSGYKFRFSDVPADYGEVLICADDATLHELKRRFAPLAGPPNLFVLKSDPFLPQLAEKSVVPSAQLYVDLWNLNTWYAKEFLDALGKRLNV